MRLSVELTPDQHQRIKATAALQGQTMREFVLDRVLPGHVDDSEALDELRRSLAERIRATTFEPLDGTTASDIFASVHNAA